MIFPVTQPVAPGAASNLPGAMTTHVLSDSDATARLALYQRSCDDILLLANLLCGTALALISLTDQPSAENAAQVGPTLAGAMHDLSFWDDVPLQQLRLIPDTRMVPDSPADSAWRFFAAVPLVDGAGKLIGTFCVVDPMPRQLSAAQQDGLRALARQISLQHETLRVVIRLEEALARLEVISATDALTGLQNRRALEQRITQEFERARRYGLMLSFLMLDVDFFKQFNDIHGHQAGDRMLCTVAQTLFRQARGQDTLARFGGEEFAVVLPNTGREGALVLAERYRAAIESLGVAHVTVSIGVATLEDAMQHPDELVSAADQALYLAKGSGRNKVIEARRR